MKLIKMQCPNCGAALEVDADRKAAFCTYCGNKLLIDDESVNINVSYRDEAKVIEAEMKRSEFDRVQSQYDAEDRDFEEKYAAWQKKYYPWKKFVLIFGLGGYALLFVIGLIVKALNINQDSVFLSIIIGIFSIPYIAGAVAFIFVGPYLYFVNPKKKYAQLVAQREARAERDRQHELQLNEQRLRKERQDKIFDSVNNVVNKLSKK